jgi:hypothetical protein
MASIQSLDYISVIKSLLLTLQKSEKMHALIVEGAAGWGKTTAVDEALVSSGVKTVHLGAYSTPLNLFNFLFENSTNFIVIDDCSGLFSDQTSMAILKAATWPQGKRRHLRWGSTSAKASIDEFDFSGKLVIICNQFPSTADADAVRSRSFPCKIKVSASRVRELLEKAASDKKWYPDTEIAQSVTKFLCSHLSGNDTQMSYRTLQMGYELAIHNTNDWENLLGGMISLAPEDPKKLVKKLSSQSIKVKDQLQKFEEITGLKRRTFFKYKKELGEKFSKKL